MSCSVSQTVPLLSPCCIPAPLYKDCISHANKFSGIWSYPLDKWNTDGTQWDMDRTRDMERTKQAHARDRAPLTSSWILDVLYKPTIDGKVYLAIFTHDGDGRLDKALLYRGTKESLPSYLPGLICAGCGGRSVGEAYNKVFKLKRAKGVEFQDVDFQEIKGEFEVRKLREMMK